MNIPTNLESRLEVAYDLRLDQPNQGKKKSILDTLHTKSEQEQADEMVDYWQKQMDLVNIFSHKERTIKVGSFNLKSTTSCKLDQPKDQLERSTLESLLMSPLDSPANLNPVQLSVRDCVEGENDARKWFVSTMHLYIKYLISRESLQKVIDQQNQKSFLGSLYDVYLSTDNGQKDSPEQAKKRLNMIREECFDLRNEDVLDQFGREVLDKGKRNRIL